MATYQQLFTYLKKKLAGGQECDHTPRLTKEFAEKHGVPFDDLSQILKDLGGYCDCEVLLNAVGKIPPHDRIGQESFKTPRQVAIEQGFFYRDASFDDIAKGVHSGPCAQDAPGAMPDLNRATIFIHAHPRQAEQNGGPETSDSPDSPEGPSPQPDVLPLAASSPESGPVVVIETVGGHFNNIYSNVNLRMALVGWEENRSTSRFDEDDEPVEIDGKDAYVKCFLVEASHGIDEKVAQALIAAGIDVPGLLDTTGAEDDSPRANS